MTSSPAAYLAKNNLSSVMPTTTERNQLAKKFLIKDEDLKEIS